MAQTHQKLSPRMNVLNLSKQYKSRNYNGCSSNKTNSAMFPSSQNQISPIDMQYHIQHHRWDDLRIKMRAMKLNNITVRSYKESSMKNMDKINKKQSYSVIVNSSHRPQLQVSNGDNMAINLPHTEQYYINRNKSRFNNNSRSNEGSTRQLHVSNIKKNKNYVNSIQNKLNRNTPNNGSDSIRAIAKKRIYHSRTNPYQNNSKSKIMDNQHDKDKDNSNNVHQYNKNITYVDNNSNPRPKTSQVSRRKYVQIEQNAGDNGGDNPEFVDVTNKQMEPNHNSTHKHAKNNKGLLLVYPNSYCNDLAKISRISDQDIQQRLIIRKKSEIINGNQEMLAWQSSIVSKKYILFLCDQTKLNQSSDSNLGLHYQSSSQKKQKKLHVQQYRLMLGPAQCKKYEQKLQITDRARLASILLDYLAIDTYNEKLKIQRDEIWSRQISMQIRMNKQQIARAIQSSPFIRSSHISNINNFHRQSKTGKFSKQKAPLSNKQHQKLMNKKYGAYMKNKSGRASDTSSSGSSACNIKQNDVQKPVIRAKLNQLQSGHIDNMGNSNIVCEQIQASKNMSQNISNGSSVMQSVVGALQQNVSKVISLIQQNCNNSNINNIAEEQDSVNNKQNDGQNMHNPAQFTMSQQHKNVQQQQPQFIVQH